MGQYGPFKNLAAELNDLLVVIFGELILIGFQKSDTVADHDEIDIQSCQGLRGGHESFHRAHPLPDPMGAQG